MIPKNDLFHVKNLTVSLIVLIIVLGCTIASAETDDWRMINEVLATNAVSHCDEFGEFDDWIEIYNSSVDPMPMFHE